MSPQKAPTSTSVVEGHKSYEVGFAAGVTDTYPRLRHPVISRTLNLKPGPGVEPVADDPAARMRGLKRHGGKYIWLVGELENILYEQTALS